MGCDAEIFGMQPDLQLQEACIRFCKALSAKGHLPPSKYEDFTNKLPLPSEYEDTTCSKPVKSSQELAQKSDDSVRSASESGISEEMQRLIYENWENFDREENEETRRILEENRGRIEAPDVVSRYSNIIFVGAPIDPEIIKNYPGKSKWTPTSFSELFALPFTGFYCMFDNDKSGLICSPYPPASCNIPHEGFEERNGHQYWLASSNRTCGENSSYYVVAHAIKRHFIPNLIFNEEYHQGNFDEIIRDIGLEDRIDQANSSDLVDVVYNGLIDSRDAYYARTNRDA